MRDHQLVVVLGQQLPVRKSQVGLLKCVKQLPIFVWSTMKVVTTSLNR